MLCSISHHRYYKRRLAEAAPFICRPFLPCSVRALGPTLPRVKSFTMWSLFFFWGFCLSSSFPDFELGAISPPSYCCSRPAARGDWTPETTRSLAIPRAPIGAKYQNKKTTLIKSKSYFSSSLIFEKYLVTLSRTQNTIFGQISVLRLF